MPSNWGGVRSRIRRLADAPHGAQVFGVSEHHFAAGPRLTEVEITNVERTFDCRLPDTYRSFLGEVGDVRAGPGYGLFPIRILAEPARREASRLPMFGDLARPFPHTADWNALPDWISEPADTPGHGERLFEWEASYFDSRWIDGALPISHLGCAMWVLLVVTGVGAGNIWVDDRANDGGIRREADSFHDWYMSWLEDAERIAREPNADHAQEVRYYAIGQDGSVRRVESS